MEGAKVTVRTRRLHSTLATVQEFVGGRLEIQWWSRAYELAAPAVRVVAGGVPLARRADWTAQKEATVSTMTKGA